MFFLYEKKINLWEFSYFFLFIRARKQQTFQHSDFAVGEKNEIIKIYGPFEAFLVFPLFTSRVTKLKNVGCKCATRKLINWAILFSIDFMCFRWNDIETCEKVAQEKSGMKH